MPTPDPFDTLPKPKIPGLDDPGLIKYVRGKGFDVDPRGQVTSKVGGRWRAPVLGGLKNFQSGYARQQNQNAGADMLGQLGTALRQDVNTQQQASDQHYDAVNQAIGGIDKSLEGIPGLVDNARGYADKFANLGQEFGTLQNDAMDVMDPLNARLGKMEANLDASGTAIDQFVKGGQDQFGRSIAGIDDAIKGALDSGRTAVARGDEAVAGFNRERNESIQATVQAMEQRARSELKMAQSGLRPDGTRMTPAEQMQMQRQVMMDTQIASASIAENMRTDAENTLAGLRMNTAQLESALSNTHLQSGGLRATQGELGERSAALGLAGEQQKQAGEQLRLGGAELGARTELQAREQQKAFGELRANLLGLESSMMNTALGQALNLELGGRTTIAEMIRQNPRSVVSMFSGLLAMYQTATAPGAAGQPGLTFGGGGF